MDLFFCQGCAHLQLLDVVDPGVLFRDYVYASGTSPVFVRHFQDYASWICSRFAVGSGDQIVELGSNDGTLLKCFQSRDCKVLGIDPAEQIAREASESGIPTRTGFFSSVLATSLSAEGWKPKVVVANNVFAHIDDLEDVALGVKTLLGHSAVFVFEVSYLLDVVQKTLFDTIYHEHLDYHSVISLDRFLARLGLELIDVERTAPHGGSLRVVAQVKGGERARSSSVDQLILLERGAGLDQADTYRYFADNIDGLRRELRAVLDRVRVEGKTIAGFGAPAKATTLMHHFGLGSKDLMYVVDDSPLKQGLYSPGLHIPIVSAQELQKRPVDYLLILAWNFSQSIIEKNTRFSDAGGRFIVPVPKVEVV